MTHPVHKSCVFCGQKPEKKNKEHVIPRWLINKTGDNKRIFHWGEYKSDGISVNNDIPFDQFTFPSCKKCNDKYSLLESKAKSIIEKIELSERISLIEIDVLLDWFDKVRIGLWLAMLILNKNTIGFDPNFFIEQRLAKKDRYLAIFRRDQNVLRCSFPGSHTLAFIHMPSAVAFVFNGLAFISISDDFLIAKNLGWPFPSRREMKASGLISIDIKEGSGKTKFPILPFRINGICTQIFQPIANDNVPAGGLYENSYIRDQLMEVGSKKSKPRIFDSVERELKTEEGLVNCTPQYSTSKNETFVDKIAIEVLKIQNHLWKNTQCSNDIKGYRHAFSRFRNLCISYNENQISAYELRIRNAENLSSLIRT